MYMYVYVHVRTIAAYYMYVTLLYDGRTCSTVTGARGSLSRDIVDGPGTSPPPLPLPPPLPPLLPLLLLDEELIVLP